MALSSLVSSAQRRPVAAGTHAPSLVQVPRFEWPGGRRGAVSLTFDDARPSATRGCAPILDAHGLRGTFFVLLRGVHADADAWRAIAAAGHEIGNHTRFHPCSGNFHWSRANALEDYTLEQMAAEIDDASDEIEEFFGTRPTSFAYCCGQKFVGRGLTQRSYVPLVAERFTIGRGFRDEFPNDPMFVDLAQVAGVDAAGLDRHQLIELARNAARNAQWLVLVGHDVGRRGPETVISRELNAFCRWLRKRDDLWVAPLRLVGAYLAQSRCVAEVM